MPNGAIWVVSRKGKAATIRDVDVIAAAKAAALVDNKVASFDDTRTSLRLVIPRRAAAPTLTRAPDPLLPSAAWTSSSSSSSS